MRWGNMHILGKYEENHLVGCRYGVDNDVLLSPSCDALFQGIIAKCFLFMNTHYYTIQKCYISLFYDIVEKLGCFEQFSKLYNYVY